MTDEELMASIDGAPPPAQEQPKVSLQKDPFQQLQPEMDAGQQAIQQEADLLKQQQREELEEQSHRVVLLLVDALTRLRYTLTMPTTDNIEDLWKIALALTGVTAISAIFSIYTFISWYGSLLNLIILTILMVKEKGDQNVITKAYQAAARRKRGKKKKHAKKKKAPK